jgi:ribosome-associated protein
MIRTMPRHKPLPAPDLTGAPDRDDDYAGDDPHPDAHEGDAHDTPASRYVDPDDRPSKSQRKRDASALQTLGTDLVGLTPARFAALALSEALRDAVVEYRRTKSFEGQRRQMQYIGRLMRNTDPEPIRQAVAEQKLGSARASLALHEAEAWRVELVAQDSALDRWLQAYPDTEVQPLRQLIRNARAEQAAADAAAARGAPARKGRAWRSLFQFIQQHLSP